MERLPVPRQSSATSLEPMQTSSPEEGELQVRHLVPLLLRNKWLLLGCALIGLLLAWNSVRSTESVYEASTTLRVDNKTPNLPDIFQAQRGGTVETDVEVLGSRTLVEDAVRELNLQVRVTMPQGVSRDALLDSIALASDASEQEYRFVRSGNGSYAVLGEDDTRLTEARIGQVVSLQGLIVQLAEEAAEHSEVRVAVSSFPDAVAATSIESDRSGEYSDIIVARYRDSDPGLVWQVPNVVAQRFIERRRDARKMEARSQVVFLRQQLDTLTKQLAAAEEEFKSFRERARVISPQIEANSQITRLVELESQRGSLEAERSALAQLMAEAEQRQARRKPTEPSAYRDLLAFPSLLRSQAASQLLNSLAQVEDQRATLLTRRTEADADVRLLSARIVELEAQLAAIARTYLQGLTNQLGSLERTSAQVNRQLLSMPRKELEYARLERTPTVLKDMYVLLQTRLKEAEIAEAVESSSITIVDPAVPPRGPIGFNSKLLMAAGLLGGLLVGVSLAMVREYADRTVRTRAQVQAATGLPVMAIIPRIRSKGRRPAVIGLRGQAPLAELTPGRGIPDPPPKPSTRPTVSYTFLSDVTTAPPESSPVPPAARPARRPPEVQMTIAGLGALMTDAYAILQTNTVFSRPEQEIRVLTFTSPLPSEGKTTTAVNFALTLCERGLAVCLIDADLRRGQVHEVFELPKGPGLSEVLRAKTPFDHAARVVRVGDFRQLSVLTCGAPVPSPPGLVGSEQMQALLKELRGHYDLIVIDTPPVNILTDAALIGVHSDGVLLVVRAGSTDIAAASYAMEQLNHVRAPTIGVVLNDVDIKRYSSYDGAYKYASYESYLTTSVDRN